MSHTVGNTIDGVVFASALISGIHRVIGQQELLNRINVFPVADRDTGTNLSLTLSSALSVLRSAGKNDLGKTLAVYADTLLDGARGNSGAIVAQFFQGMSDSAGEITHFTTQTFGDAVNTGSEYAHDALSKPREGTILSVIAAFSESIRQQLSQEQNCKFPPIVEQARITVEVALANTPNQLDVLRKAGVVDAGAKGFAELVGGMADFLNSGHIAPMPETALLSEIEPPVRFSEADNASTYRYCTECLVTGTDIDRRKLREALGLLGDSVVLAGSKRKAKIHIHVDDPDAVFAVARKFGQLGGEKADDMHRQQHATHDGARKFAVITDSGADISDEDMERLDIHMVPCRIQFGDRGYLDKVSITTDEFYSELRNNPHHPTSSQPAPGDFRRQFQFLASHFHDVLSINLTSKASGTYQGACSAAMRVKAPGRIHVVDSCNASMGQGQLVVLAAECAAAGLDIDETISVVSAAVPKTRTFALLNNLEYAVRGGRVPQWVKSLTDLLRLIPVIRVKVDGQIALGGFLYGRRNRIAKFARFITRRTNGKAPLEIGIGHAICEAESKELAARLRAEFPSLEKLTICSLGTGLGVHGGPGTLIVSTKPYASANDLASRFE